MQQAKLAKLRREILEPAKGGGGGGKGEGFDVTKAGDSRIGLVGALTLVHKHAALLLTPSLVSQAFPPSASQRS